MARPIMIQGTMSGAGKSLLCAGLCRIFREDGYRVAPFKSQNMALNSFVTEDGLEMGRAQVLQAEAAGVKPNADMNPVLLKPTGDTGSQVIVNGEVLGNMSARDYYREKEKLVPDILAAYGRLSEQYDIIVIEGAGSPAEINLREHDIVNMGLAEMVDAPVLLAGDIDRGGVFAQLCGTMDLLTEPERNRVKGLIINKFRGDKSILDPGIRMLEERVGKPVCGTVPWMELALEDEDSLTDRFGEKRTVAGEAPPVVDLAVIRFPRISNFTDFDVFERFPGVSVRYVRRVSELGNPDLIFLPGTKNTMADFLWFRESGLEAAVLKRHGRGAVLFGICGGFQMLGRELSDPEGVENPVGAVPETLRGMGLLPLCTVLSGKKTRAQVTGRFGEMSGPLKALSGMEYSGYEIHMGKTKNEAACDEASAVYGSYVHGLFDQGAIAETLLQCLAERKGQSLTLPEYRDFQSYRESQFRLLSDTLRKSLDMELIYRCLGLSGEPGGAEERPAETDELTEQSGAPRYELLSPAEIEHRSFQLIRQELRLLGPEPEPFELPVLSRVIHTTADFSYRETLWFSPGWKEAADRAFCPGAVLVTDTNMALAGIAKRPAEELGITLRCFMADREVAEEAKRQGVTRAYVSAARALRDYGNQLIFVCGNAPTALIALSSLIREGVRMPALVIGVPVGFVNVEQSKEELIQTGVPCIVSRGRKGGSTVAAAIVNALLYQRAAARGSAPRTQQE